jgi:hypothetical protein
MAAPLVKERTHRAHLACLHCQRFRDFPAFPVFPAESLVLAENRTPYRLGLAAPSEPQAAGRDASGIPSRNNMNRIDDA